MAWQIVIDFDLPADTFVRSSLIHRICNFGEDLNRAFRGTRLAQVDLADIDRATDRICMSAIKNRQVRTVSGRVRKILERHHLDEVARLTEVKSTAVDA
jgi:hypothetical protein